MLCLWGYLILAHRNLVHEIMAYEIDEFHPWGSHSLILRLWVYFTFSYFAVSHMPNRPKLFDKYDYRLNKKNVQS